MTPSKSILCLQASSLLESYGGIEYYLDDLLSNATSLLGEERVRALVPKRKPGSSDATFFYPVSVVSLSANRLLSRVENRFSPRFYSAARKLIREHKPSLILVGHVSLGPIGYLLSRLTGIPYATCVYGLEAWGDLWPQDEWALRRAGAIFSISEWTKQILVGRGYSPDRIAVIHPIMASEFESRPVPAKRPAPSPMTFLSVSRLDASERYKGQDHMIEALHRLLVTRKTLPVRYLIQGEGNDKRRLQELVKERGLENVVEFLPKVETRQELDAVYQRADVFVLPSRFGKWGKRWRGEGFGIVYVEAAAFGVPSIAYDCGGARDIIVPLHTGWLVDPDNIAELARTVEQCLEKPEWVRELGDAAYYHVMQHFTPGVMQRQIAEALKLF